MPALNIHISTSPPAAGAFEVRWTNSHASRNYFLKLIIYLDNKNMLPTNFVELKRIQDVFSAKSTFLVVLLTVVVAAVESLSACCCPQSGNLCSLRSLVFHCSPGSLLTFLSERPFPAISDTRPSVHSDDCLTRPSSCPDKFMIILLPLSYRQKLIDAISPDVWTTDGLAPDDRCESDWH